MKGESDAFFSGRETQKKIDCGAEREDVAVMSSLFADIVLRACHCILNDLAGKVADN